MKKTLKVAALALGALLALLAVALTVLVLVFDPNQYKDEIVRLVKARTGRELRIEQRIGWSFLPRLGIEAGGLELANAPGFGKEPFARVEAAGVRVELLALLAGRFAVDTLYVHGVTLNLARDARGRNNWEDLAGAAKATPPPAPTPSTAPGAARALAALTIGRLELRRGNLTFRDAAAASLLAVRDLTLTTGRFAAGAPFDLALAFELAGATPQPARFALRARATAAANAVRLDGLDLTLDDSRLRGSLELNDFARPALRFDLALDRLDLDRYLPKTAAAAAAPPAAAGAGAGTAAPLATLRGLDLQGRLQVDALKAFGLRLQEARLQLAARDGLITIGPNQAKLYGGGYRGQTVLDARGKTLALRSRDSVSGVQLGPLAKDAWGLEAFHGTASLDARLSTQGLDPAGLRAALNGSASVAIQDGTIKGVDLKKMADAIERAVREKRLEALGELAPGTGDETRFTRLGGSVQITNGVARNDDLAIESPGLLRVSGRGTADLVRERLDYRLDLGSVPLLVQGPFTALKYRPDTSGLAKKAVDRQLERLKERLRRR